MRALSAALVTVAVASLLSAGAGRAAAPRIVIVSGKPLLSQVVISDWQAILKLVEALLPARVAPGARLAARPRLKISMFWGPRWSDYLKEGNRASALRPRRADQAGTFYPAWHGRPALIDLGWVGRWPRVVPPVVLAILKRFGVPTDVR